MIDLCKPQIRDLFDFHIAADAIRAAFVASAKGQVQAPPIAQLAFPENEGDCCVKTGHVVGAEGFVVKVSTGFYRNPAQGLPSSNGMNLVFSATNGAPLAILRDEGWLTDIRTGIGGALATAALAPAGFTEVLIVGTGLQARHQAECLQLLVDRPLTFKIWGRDLKKAEAVVVDLQAEGLSAALAADLQAACLDAQAIVTCTPSKQPLIKKHWITPSTHITAIGADCPGKQELARDLTEAADLLICDEATQSLHHGEFQHLSQGTATIALGDVLDSRHPGRSDVSQITIADLTGLAVQDAAVSLAVVQAFQNQTSNENEAAHV
ncbi:ornithine cyclodeaminase family protein [Shimia sp. R10_1]|uniref:ornithine cyclodeaminase family protein n=1 Tax=Shimia sp. R10_1 TaxID=2821095 RepID=UPI001ADA1141|nr:ornithine cyclodeaminase family protein [Shimia sp. R10_1]